MPTIKEYLNVEEGSDYPTYAWPGGYEIIYVADDGEYICAACVNDHTNPVHEDGEADGWKLIGHTTTGDIDHHVFCAHCNRQVV